MVSLPGVEIWTACWSQDKAMALRHAAVLEYCSKILQPTGLLFFTAIRVPVALGIKIIPIQRMRSMAQFNVFVNYQVPKYARGEFLMSVHEDGFPLHPELWSDEFLAYDYIGAPWPNGLVGNGGFNLESRRLLRAKLRIPQTNAIHHPSDNWVCQVHRAELERQGIRFAPTEVALRFSTEYLGNDRPSFGFHGRGVCAAKYAEGWRQIEATRTGLPVQPLVPARPMPQISVPGLPLLVYCHPVTGYQALARAFMTSYRRYPPGIEHASVVLLNGGEATAEIRGIFEGLSNVTFVTHDNTGWDIGGYLKLARVADCQFMFCMGAHGYFRRPGWLRRIASVWEEQGPGFYGTLATYEVSPHFCTTGFAVSPEILCGYSAPVITKEDRYGFEHGQNSLVRSLIVKGYPVKLVTWDGVYSWRDWRCPANIYVRGDQSNCLTFFKHSDSYELSDYNEKRRRERLADNLWIFDRAYMRTAVLYLHVVGKSDDSAPGPEYYRPWSERFIASYRNFKGNAPHELVVMSCGGPVNDATRAMFPEAVRFLEYRGGGWDIGAMQSAAHQLRDAFDYVIAIATPVYFWKPGFIERMIQARERHGDGIFGPTASYENRPHIRTCCWAFSPHTFCQYPHLIDTRDRTFRAESGDLSITFWYKDRGQPQLLVTANGEYAMKDWRRLPNIFRRGNQSNCLVRDRHTDLYEEAEPVKRQELAALADGPKNPRTQYA